MEGATLRVHRMWDFYEVFESPEAAEEFQHWFEWLVARAAWIDNSHSRDNAIDLYRAYLNIDYSTLVVEVEGSWRWRWPCLADDKLSRDRFASHEEAVDAVTTFGSLWFSTEDDFRERAGDEYEASDEEIAVMEDMIVSFFE